MREYIRRLSKLTRGQAAVRIYQVCSLLPLLYILTASGQTSVMLRRGFLYGVFQLGLACLPRAEVYGLSWLYRLTGSELIVYFAILFAAMAIGIAGDRLARGRAEARRKALTVYAVLIAADLVLRLLPLRVNTVQGWGLRAAGFAVRAVCLYLAVSGLRKQKKA